MHKSAFEYDQTCSYTSCQIGLECGSSKADLRHSYERAPRGLTQAIKCGVEASLKYFSRSTEPPDRSRLRCSHAP